MPTFTHAGDLGDIVVSLPVIKAKGGGGLYIQAASYTRQRLIRERFAPLVPLLENQDYIAFVKEWQGENTDIDLNVWRFKYFAMLRKDIDQYRTIPLWAMYQDVYDVDPKEWQRPWLAVTPELRRTVDGVVVNRSPRYRNPQFKWHRVGDKYGYVTGLGLPDESPGFEHEDWYSFLATKDLLEAAHVIAASKLFIGNQSCLYHIAEGLKKPSILEEYPQMPNCRYPARPNAWIGDSFLPDLKDLP